MLITFILFVVIFSFGYACGKSRSKALENTGEGLVRRSLTQTFPDDEFHLLNNITLAYAGSTTQIDHVLVSTKGIFVIETKHYAGLIFADEKAAKWTQVIHKTTRRFQNPIRQNYRHILAVRKLLDFLPGEVIHSVVVFTGTARFRTEKPVRVFDLDELTSYIKALPDDRLSKNRMALSVGRMECARYQLSKETDIEHQNNLAQRFGSTQHNNYKKQNQRRHIDPVL